MPCAIAGRYGERRRRRGGQKGCAPVYGGSARWEGEGEDRKRDVRPTKNQTKRIPARSPPLSPPFLRHPPPLVSANLLLPANVTRSAARERTVVYTGSDEISTNLFCYRILIRFVQPYSQPRPKFRTNKRAPRNCDGNGTLLARRDLEQLLKIYMHEKSPLRFLSTSVQVISLRVNRRRKDTKAEKMKTRLCDANLSRSEKNRDVGAVGTCHFERLLTKLEITPATREMPLRRRALRNRRRDGNMQSGKTRRNANVVVVVGAETQLSLRRRTTYRELNDAWNPGIPRQSYIIKRVYDISHPG